nr:hypothetical protein [Tanacetum cinerariifolium]
MKLYMVNGKEGDVYDVDMDTWPNMPAEMLPVGEGTHPSMIRVFVTIKILVMTNLHSILLISNNSLNIVRSVEVPIIALIVEPGTNLCMSLLWDTNHILEELLRTLKTNSPVEEPEGVMISRGGVTKGDNKIDSLTMAPSDTFLMGDKCSMPLDSPPSLILDVLGERKVDIDLPFGEHLDTLSTGDKEIDFNPRDIETIDLIPVPWVFDEPLGNSDSVPRYYDSRPPKSTPVIDESSLLVTPPPASKQLSLREVERFDLFFSLTQSGEEPRVMEIPSFGFHHISSSRPAAYSPKEVIYRFYHPHLTSGDGFDPESKKIPSGESEVHIENLSVLWDAIGSCRLGRSMSQKLKDHMT